MQICVRLIFQLSMSCQKVVMITGGILAVYVLGTFLQWKVRWKYMKKALINGQIDGEAIWAAGLMSSY